MSLNRIISLVYQGVPVQSLQFKSSKRKETVIEMWKHLYGKSFNKATITITKP